MLRAPTLAVTLVMLVLLLSRAPAGAYASAPQGASMVIGQQGFTTDDEAASQAGMYLPTGLAFDAKGDLWVADFGNNRVLEYPAPLSSGEAASVVIGQQNFTADLPGAGATGLHFPVGLAFDPNGDLWVADYQNSRVLEYTPPFTNGEAASVVIGQQNFTSTAFSTTQTGLYSPKGVTFDSQGDLWVADYGNSRVLEYTAPFTTGEAAHIVVGQPSFDQNGILTSQTKMNEPEEISFDTHGNLWVVDYGNSRVTEYPSPLTSGEAASVVIGEPNFTTNETTTFDHGLSFAFDLSPTTALDEHYPQGLAFDPAGNLWVADSQNNRVLEYTSPFGNGETATRELGQSGYATNYTRTTQTGLFDPVNLAFDSQGNLWIADSWNNRVVEYSAATITAPTGSALSGVGIPLLGAVPVAAVVVAILYIRFIRNKKVLK